MKRYLLKTAFLILLIFTPVLFAATPQYAILIDAGSTGSRLHLFRYEPGKPLPYIQDIFAAHTKPGISSFSDHPEEAALSLKQMLDDAEQQLKQLKVDPHTVSVTLLATAGMRLLPFYVQDDIYKNIRSYIHEHYAFTVGDVKTISGKLEGVYGWLDVNYLLNRLKGSSYKTQGSIDMGGASTQIAFSTEHPAPGTFSVTLGKKTFNILSKSFLGMGLTQALQHVNLDPLAAACYPMHYAYSHKNQGSFNFNICSSLYSNLIHTQQIAKILPLPNQDFVAFSGAYHTFQFFGLHPQAHFSTVKERVNTVCNKDWDQLKKEYPLADDKQLSSVCANGVYLATLLYETYQLADNQLTVTRELKNHEVDWTLGALLYRLIQPPARPLIVDTDGGTDDGIALLYLLKNPHIEIKAITIEGDGIVRCPAATAQVQQLLRITEHDEIPIACGQDVPLKGNHHYPSEIVKANEELGYAWAASSTQSAFPSAEKLLEGALKSSLQKIDILAIGPMTTIAQVLEAHPEIKEQMGRIIIMGGAVNVPGNVHKADPRIKNTKAEWNFYIDPYAADVVIQSHLPITLVPLDVTNQVPLDMEFYKQIESWGNTKEGSFLYRLLTQNKAMLLKHEWYFWDPLAAAIAVDPSIVTQETLPITVIQEPESESGATVVDKEKGIPIDVCTHVDSQKFISEFLEMTI